MSGRYYQPQKSRVNSTRSSPLIKGFCDILRSIERSSSAFIKQDGQEILAGSQLLGIDPIITYSFMALHGCLG